MKFANNSSADGKTNIEHRVSSGDEANRGILSDPSQKMKVNNVLFPGANLTQEERI